MIKRNNDGYVLAYVMVVIAVVGLISVSLMTSTMNVMQAQQASIQHMKDKYEAQGEIERLVAELEHILSQYSTSVDVAEFNSPEYEESSDARNNAKSHLSALVSSAKNFTLNLPDDATPYFTHEEICIFTYTYDSDSNPVSITAELAMPYRITINSHDHEGAPVPDPNNPDKTIASVDTDYSYTLIIKSLDIISYEISSKEVSSDPSEEDAT